MLLLFTLLFGLSLASPSFARRTEESLIERSECWACQKVVHVARTLDGGNLEERLDEVCDHVFSWMKPKCESLVDRYYDDLLLIDDASLTDAQVCSSLCSEPEVLTTPFLELQQPAQVLSEPFLELEQPAQVLSEPFLELEQPGKPHDDSIGCTLCTLIVGFAEDKLESNATIDKIIEFLNTTVCTLLPGSLKDDCQALVDEYGPRIAEKIEKGYPASVVCEDIGLCPKQKMMPLVKLVAPIAPAVMSEPFLELEQPGKPHDDSIGCTICTLIVGFAEDKLESNATVDKILEFLNTTVCSLFPGSLKDDCQALVDEYGPRIAEKIEKGYPASVVCQDIGLCPKSRKPATSAVAQPAPLGIGCTICSLIIGYAEDKLDSNATVSEVEKFLNTSVCKFLPSFLRPECDSLVDEYAPVIAKKITEKYPASVICKDIHLCSSSNKKPVLIMESFLELEQPKKESDGIVCAVCRLAINAAEEELDNSATDEKIEKFFNSTLCSIIPRLFRAECTDLVTSYLPTLVGNFLEGHNATEICTDDIHVC